MSCGFVVDSTEIYLCCSCMPAGWSLDNRGKGGWDLKLVKDAILLALYDILMQNLPSIYSCHVELRSTF